MKRNAPLSRPHTRRPSPSRTLCAAVGFAPGLFVILAFSAYGALAHVIGEVPERTELPWSFEPWVLVCLALSAGLYAVGIARLWQRAGRGRGVSRAAVGAFASGWIVLVAALVSPVDALGSALFSGHMVQHELLMIVAAPLLVLGRPLAAWVWAFPPVWRTALGEFFHRAAWRTPWLVLTGPLWAWILHALALWLWHVPVLFEAALANEAVHAFQHICFLATALVFWWSVLGGATRRKRGLALLSLFTTMVHTGALGALLTLSTVVWYPSYAATAPAWGLTALEDQQLGGVVMWVPAGLVYLLIALMLAGHWLAQPPRRSGRQAPSARGRSRVMTKH